MYIAIQFDKIIQQRLPNEWARSVIWHDLQKCQIEAMKMRLERDNNRSSD